MEIIPVFDVKDVSYSYDNQITALDHVSLAVGSGERLAILGSNGCGKSTLLKILDGLYFPSQGTVSAFGSPLTEQAFQEDAFNFDFRRRVSLVFQDSDVQLFMPSVWDELAFAPLQLEVDQNEVKRLVEAALHDLQIEKLRERAPHQLSGGEKKRVALASVLGLSPQVWLLDEPSAGLDPRSVAWLLDFIDRQAQAGKTVITATHDLGILGTIAGRVVVLGEDHRIVAEGTPQQILADQAMLVSSCLMRAV
ncbi:MAG: energy-coupling factor ABC transporter ATP-binding protein [Anaerolineales bacterium]